MLQILNARVTRPFLQEVGAAKLLTMLSELFISTAALRVGMKGNGLL